MLGEIIKTRDKKEYGKEKRGKKEYENMAGAWGLWRKLARGKYRENKQRAFRERGIQYLNLPLHFCDVNLLSFPNTSLKSDMSVLMSNCISGEQRPSIGSVAHCTFTSF